MPISPERFSELKARVKAECLRRSKSGDISSYGGSAYDYSIQPTSHTIIRDEHRDKIAIPLNAIDSNKVPNQTGQNVVLESDITTMETFISALEIRGVEDKSGTDCRSGCTGLCYGCTGSCTGTCIGSCTGGCQGCRGTCIGSCQGCRGTCTGSCQGCRNTCTGSCTGCRGTCRGSCRGGCNTTCTGQCSRTCQGKCTSGCTGSCTTTNVLT